MCGIAGIIRADGRPSQDAVRAMVAAIRHRGPDWQEVQDVDGVAVLGHARLSILDLSPAANQPMCDPLGRYTIVYNGEVYNFRELRSELEACGVAFRTTGDTEVVLHAIVRWGPSALKRFNGMFALALWDGQERELLLARDRFGKKPLYFSLRSGECFFASELRALECVPLLAPHLKVSLKGLNHLLALGYILAPTTIYEGVEKLEAATFARVRGGRVVERTRYWDYAQSFRRAKRVPVWDAIRDIDILLGQAVSRRLVSDVPVGAFLSGGVDSSSVVAYARSQLPYELHTFNVGFEEATYDESADAQRVAKEYGTTHHETRIRTAHGAELTRQALRVFDEPFADTSLVPMVEVSRSARPFVKVVLSGDGADELFGGYATYTADAVRRGLAWLPAGVRQLVARSARLLDGSSSRRLALGFKARQFARGLGEDWRFAHYVWREVYSEPERVTLLGRANEDAVRAFHPFADFVRHYDEVTGLDPVSQCLYVDAKTWLTDDILVKVDRATMAVGLEARAPYLDVDLVEYVAGLPARYKVVRGRGKWVLKLALRGKVPMEILTKRKAGFNAPVNAWFRNSATDEYRWFVRLVLANHSSVSSVRPTIHW
jgi:asparagine synthase (glutamine-hydrolysing)